MRLRFFALVCALIPSLVACAEPPPSWETKTVGVNLSSPAATFTPVRGVAAAENMRQWANVIRWDAVVTWNNVARWDEATRPPDPPHVRLPAPRPVRRPTVPANHTAVTSGCYGWADLIASLWPADQVATACRILGCESGGNPNARNKSGAVGLFQLLGHGGTTDPVQNASVAHRLWLAEGWSPWVCR